MGATASKDQKEEKKEEKKEEEEDNKKQQQQQLQTQTHPNDVNAPSQAATSSSSRPSMYPTVETEEIAISLFPDESSAAAHEALATTEETLLTIPGSLLYLVDPDSSVYLGAGSLSIRRLRQEDHDVALFARLTPAPPANRWRWILAATGQGKDKLEEPVQWPLTHDVAAVKLDTTQYFFSLHVPHTLHPDELAEEAGEEDEAAAAESEAEAVISYGLTLAGKGQEKLLEEFDKILETYTSFSVHKVVEAEEKGKEKDKGKSSAPNAEVLDTKMTKEITPAEALGDKKEVVQERSAAYWTTLAPNVDDYSSHVARLIAGGSGLMIRGILWTGDVTANQLRWGEQMLMKKVGPAKKPAKVKARSVRRMKRARMLTTMSDKVANSILSGVLKVSGFFSHSLLNSKPAQKFFKLMPGEVVLASLDGFGRVWDAIEVSGKNVLQTTSIVTTGVATHRYGDQAGELTNEYLHATGHALGAAWAVFKIRKALDPKGVVKPQNMVESALHVAANESIAKQKRK